MSQLLPPARPNAGQCENRVWVFFIIKFHFAELLLPEIADKKALSATLQSLLQDQDLLEYPKMIAPSVNSMMVRVQPLLSHFE